MKKILAIMLPLAIITGLLSGCMSRNETEQVSALGFISIDINPSIQIVTEDDEVVSVTASNNEGEMVLIEIVEDIIGNNIGNALDKILDSSIELGFIDVDALLENPNIISIATILENRANSQHVEYRQMVSSRLENRMKNFGIYGAVIDDLDLEGIIDEAASRNISVARYRLMKSMVDLNPNISFEDISDISNSDLIEQIRERGRNVEDIKPRIENRIDLVEFFDQKVIEIQNKISAFNSELIQRHNSVALLEQVDFVVEEYSEAQIIEHNNLIGLLNSEIDEINSKIDELEIDLSGLQNAMEVHSDRLENLFVNIIQNSREEARSNFEDRFNDWQDNRDQRIDDVASNWNSFRNDQVQDNISNILDRIANRFNNNTED